jgi:hypothetical protein
MSRQVEESDVAVSAKSNRIQAFDVIRGFFLLVILIDHIELYPSIFDLFTGRGRLFVSAAEGFFFMSGLLVGLVYKRRLALGMKFIFKKMWRRATELYVGSVILSLLFTYWAIASNHPEIKEGLPSPIHWGHIIQQTLLMRYGYGWADFLDRFALLMFIAPLAFYLIAKGRWRIMLALSLITWALRGGNFTLGWQLIFNSGILIGFYWYEIRQRVRSIAPKLRRNIKRVMLLTTAVTFGFSYASVYLLSLLNQHYSSLTPWLRHLTFTWNNYNADIWVYTQKWTMGPLRVVLFFLWFAALFYLVEKYHTGISRRTRGIIELIGRNSLFVYITHAFIVFVFQLFIPSPTSLWQNFLITLAALSLLIVITLIYRPLRTDWAENHSFSLRSIIAKTKAELAG